MESLCLAHSMSVFQADVELSDPNDANSADLLSGPSPGDSSKSERERFLVAFSGGGAKGLVHVGAYKHLYDSNREIACVAGTSAGALVAALIAAGYTPDDILEKDGTSPLWRAIQKQFKVKYPSELLGPDYEHLLRLHTLARRGAWIRFIREAFGRKPVYFFGILSLIFTPWIMIAFTQTFHFWFAVAPSGIALHAVSGLLGIFSFLVACLYGLLLVAKKFKEGVSQLDKIERVVEFCLQRKLLERTSQGPVLFEELYQTPIKVVATNVSTCTPAVFSTDSTPKESVARAVSASICLPYVFSPALIGDHQYLDGGITSNLPAWVFEEERLMAPSLRAVAFSVSEETVPVKQPKWLRELKRKLGLSDVQMLFNSIMHAHQSLGLRSLVDLSEVNLKSKLHVLQFRFTEEDAAEILSQGQSVAKEIENYFSTIPDIYCDLAEEIRVDASRALRKLLKAETGVTFSSKRIRVSFAVLQPQRPGTLWIKFSSGFRRSKDKGITIPMRTSTAGLAFSGKRQILTIPGVDSTGVLEGKSDGFLRSLIGDSLQWIYAVPVILEEVIQSIDDDGNEYSKKIERKMVVTIDGQDDIVLGISHSVERRIEARRDEVSAILTGCVQRALERRVKEVDETSLSWLELFPGLEDASSKHI